MSTIKKFLGIANSNQDDDLRESQQPNTPEQQSMYDMVMADFEFFRPPRELMDDKWREEQRMYNGDHWYGQRSEEASRHRPNAIENVFFSQIEAIKGKLTGWTPFPNFSEVEDGDKDKASILNDYMPSELKQIRFRQKFIKAVHRCVLHGPMILKVVHDPDYMGGRGEYKYQGRNDILPVDLFSFYPDPRITDPIELQKMSAIIIKPEPQPLEYFRKRWPDQGPKVSPDNPTYASDNTGGYQDANLFNRDVVHNGGGRVQREQTAGYIEYWYKGKPKVVTRQDREAFKDAAEMALEDGRDPSEYAAKIKGTMEGIHCIYVTTSGVFLEHKAYVYDHGQFPFQARVLYPEEGNFFGKGFGRDMISPQRFLNKYAEIIIETYGKQGNSAILYEEGAITKPRVWQEQRSKAGAMLPTASGMLDRVKELQGVSVPPGVMQMLQYYLEIMQKIPGQYDSANGQADSRVTSGEQAKALMAAAGTRLNTISDMISEMLEETFQQYVELMVQFYTDERVSRVNGRRVSLSRAALVSSVPTEYVAQEALMDDELMPPNPEATIGEDGMPVDPMMREPEGMMDPMRSEPAEAEVLTLNEEFIPEFDISVNIGVDKPQDREYWMQLAFNMLQMIDPITQLPMIDAEAVRYVIDTGRMEPMDVIQRRIEQSAQQSQQTQQAQQELQQLQQQNAQLQAQVEQLGGAQAQQQQQAQQFEQQFKTQKLELEAAKTAHNIMKDQASGQGGQPQPQYQNFDVTQQRF